MSTYQRWCDLNDVVDRDARGVGVMWGDWHPNKGEGGKRDHNLCIPQCDVWYGRVLGPAVPHPICAVAGTTPGTC